MELQNISPKFLLLSMPSFADILLVFLSTDLPQDFDNFESSMDATLDDALDEFMGAESTQPVVEEGCEVTGKVPLSSSKPKHGVPAVDPEIGASSTSFDTAGVRHRIEIPSPVSPIGKSLLITLPARHDMGNWLMGGLGHPSVCEEAVEECFELMDRDSLFWSLGCRIWHDQTRTGDSR